MVERQTHAPIGQTDDLIGCKVAAYLDLDQSGSRGCHTMDNVGKTGTQNHKLYHKYQTFNAIIVYSGVDKG